MVKIPRSRKAELNARGRCLLSRRHDPLRQWRAERPTDHGGFGGEAAGVELARAELSERVADGYEDGRGRSELAGDPQLAELVQPPAVCLAAGGEPACVKPTGTR